MTTRPTAAINLEDVREPAYLAEVVLAADGRPSDYRILEVNARFETLLGRARAEIVGRTARELWPGIAERWIAEYGRVALGGAPQRIDGPAESMRHFVETFAYSPAPGRFVCLVSDATARRLAGVRDRELLQSLFDRIPVMLVLWDPRLHRFTLNAHTERVLGWTTDDANDGEFMAKVYPDPAYRAEVTGYMQSLEPGWRELHTTAKDGRQVPCHWANTLLSDDTMIGIGVDLREAKRAEKELLHALALAEDGQRTLATLMEYVPEGIAISEGRGVMRMVSRYGENDFGPATEGMTPEAYAAPLRVFEADGCTPVPGDRLPLVRAVQAGESVRDLDIVVIDAVGRRRSLLCNAAPIRNARGQITGGIVTWRDITERKAAEDALLRANQRLEEADRRKDEFLAVLSHELRNPLAPLRNSLYLLHRLPSGSEQARAALAIMDRQVAQLARIVDDLLEVNRITTGKLRVQREPLNVADLVLRTIEDHRIEFAEHGVELEVRLPAGPVPVDGDPARLMQAIGNLLHNAAKFTPPGGHVVVSVESSGDQVAVTVSDDGVGIEPALLRRVFDPFAQGDRSLDRSSGGLGLGLSIVAGVIALHDGTVEAHSDGPGRGARFAIRLPSGSSGATSQSAASRGRAVARARRVLVIEDNVDAAESLRQLLAVFGHFAHAEHSGADGLRAFQDMQPDTVLCDIGLPVMNGYEVARAIRALENGAPRALLVALTGYGMDDDRRRAAVAGFDAHITKPVDPELLERLLGRD